MLVVAWRVVMEAPEITVQRFNTCINRRDLDQLGRLLHTDLAL